MLALAHPSSMFTMSQHQYGFATAPPPRQYSGHGTSSAFSSSANPDEDWTKISDLAERRRIQNRIAQRNYRKKLKRRLEDLERRASSEEEEDISDSAKIVPAVKKQKSPSSSSKPKPQNKQTLKSLAVQQYTPPMTQEDEFMFQSAYDNRSREHTPPLFGYPAYPPPDEANGLLLAPFTASATSQPQHYRPMVSESHYGYLAATTATAMNALAAPVTLPSMTHFSDAIAKGDAGLTDEYGLASYALHDGYLPSIDIAGPGPYDSHPHTPLLSCSFEHSIAGSETSFEMPTTPLSMPGSPLFIQA